MHRQGMILRPFLMLAVFSFLMISMAPVPAFAGWADEVKEALVLHRWVSGWAVGESADGYGTIIHTTDGGKTWVRQGNPEMIPDAFLNGVSAVDHWNAWVVGDSSGGYGTILRTTDGGKTWIRQGSALSIPDVDFSGVSAVDREVAWAVGWNGVVLNTIDGGATWVQQAQGLLPDAQFQNVSAYDRNNVWAVEPG
jgi:photosystem II stability/assembly factor-like uncharacterized protein